MTSGSRAPDAGRRSAPPSATTATSGPLTCSDATSPRPVRTSGGSPTSPYVATWSGIVYVAFVVDVFSRAIVGWSAATSKRAKLVLDALDMALWRRDRDGIPAGPGLVHHSDAGSQGGFNRLSQHRRAPIVDDRRGLPRVSSS
ncbi:DDE-type integrase/transposase/recombinase [Streptomyces sp. NPDC017179]|uniref:DDE-type integrase/transposase/recombinase n=1 Tax=Streptomyces sp. NPDC017179 TaxID=3364979 RepID=UPI0037B5EB81